MVSKSALSQRKPNGVISRIYQGQLSTSKKRGHPVPAYTKSELKEWLLKHDFELLYARWEQSDYDVDLKPSVDRLDDSLPYTFENIQLIVWRGNKEKQYLKQDKIIDQFTKEGVFVKTHSSITQAAIAMGVHERNISWAVSGKYKTSCGYVWKINTSN